MEEQLPYRAEYAKTGRAKCKGCKSGIGAGELRVAAMVQSPFHDGKQANWFHCDCFFIKQRPKCTTDIAYFFTLKYDDQQRLKFQIESNVVAASTTAVSTGKGGKRSKPCDALKDFGIEYSKSSRADCRACQQKIMKGELRIKKVSFETEVGMKYGGQPLWHHVECFEKIRDELLYFESGDKLPGFKTLKKDDQEMVKNAIHPKTEAPEVKKIKKEEKDSELIIVQALEFEKEMKKQNDTFYKYKLELEKFSKYDLIDFITKNNQKMPDGLSAVKALDLAADLLTFGAPEKCTECSNGVFTLGNNTYVCNGAIDEWAKCSNKTQDPLRTATIIPEDLKEKFPFLKTYKEGVTKRLFETVAPALKTSGIKNETIDETDQPKIQREKPKLYKMIFLVVGKTQTDLSQLKKIITQFGGEVKTKLNDKITVVISNQQEIDKMNNRMTDVKHLDLPVISDDFFTQLNKNSDSIQLMQKFTISPWTDVLSKVPQKLDEKEEDKKLQKSAYTKSSKSSKITMKIKGGGAVDPDSNLDSVAHVYEKNNRKYNSILSLADLQTGQNSFYKLQILQADRNPTQFWLFRSWGRIGTSVGGNKLESFNDATLVIGKFEFHYADKTKNVFGAKEFQKFPGYYNPIDVEFEEVQNKFAKECNIPSKLDEPIQNLIKLMFDIDLMKQTMIQFEIDTEKMPLGKLSKSQIEKALIALNDLTLLIDRGAKETEFISPTNRFYTLIPHNFGMKTPPLLNSTEIIKQKNEMLESLMEIELAYNLLNDVNITDDVNPVDAHYDQLKTNMEVLNPNSKEYKNLQLYVQNTHADTHNMYGLEIQNIYKICRESESERFEKYKKLHNRKLLWHGSRLTNFVGILKNGLRIAPPEAPCTGYMFGKGIYFADMVSKSANYCFTSHVNNTGLLLLCDVALGNMQEFTSGNYVTELPKGKHSTKGVGNTQPDPKGSIKQEGIEIPCGKPLKGNKNSHLLYNEFIIYDIEQVNVKYLLNLTFDYSKNYANQM